MGCKLAVDNLWDNDGRGSLPRALGSVGKGVAGFLEYLSEPDVFRSAASICIGIRYEAPGVKLFPV